MPLLVPIASNPTVTPVYWFQWCSPVMCSKSCQLVRGPQKVSGDGSHQVLSLQGQRHSATLWPLKVIQAALTHWKKDTTLHRHTQHRHKLHVSWVFHLYYFILFYSWNHYASHSSLNWSLLLSFSQMCCSDAAVNPRLLSASSNQNLDPQQWFRIKTGLLLSLGYNHVQVKDI